MILESRTLALIAVGASIAANCQPCVKRNVSAALACGANDRQIAEAVEVGRKVRQGAASKMDLFVSSLNQPVPASADTGDNACGCHSRG
jgi:AhpD family alkylhydroperoxidase